MSWEDDEDWSILAAIYVFFVAVCIYVLFPIAIIKFLFF